jgi:transcriptional regulator with XRE-family HTH domain
MYRPRAVLAQSLVAPVMHTTQSPSLMHDLRTLHGANVRRLMARLDMTQQDVVDASGLDQRTVRSILQGITRPHARTLHKLAEGLGVAADELFQDPYQAGQAAFDRATNPVVADVVETRPELFEGWTQADFNELFSRMALGGALTESGVLASVEAMNARHQLLQQVAVILESGEAELMREFVALLFRRVTAVDSFKD